MVQMWEDTVGTLTVLHEAVHAYHTDMPPTVEMEFVRSLRRVQSSQDGNPLKVATMFSGCDIVVKSLRTLSKYWAMKYSVDVMFEHAFAAESCPRKQ